jgi:hypothetical protein
MRSLENTRPCAIASSVDLLIKRFFHMQVITKLLYLLHQGETFTKVGAFMAVA